MLLVVLADAHSYRLSLYRSSRGERAHRPLRRSLGSREDKGQTSKGSASDSETNADVSGRRGERKVRILAKLARFTRLDRVLCLDFLPGTEGPGDE